MTDTTDSKSIAQASFNITDSAAGRISYLMSDEEDKNLNLRISVLGGGCSGFQYKYEFDPKKNEDDLSFKKNDIQVVIDNTSIEFLNNCTLDYVETLGAAAFEIKNPNATANCGCGNSFSV